MSNLYIIDHPLVQNKMALLRNKNTNSKEFREVVGEVASLIFYEATKSLPLKPVQVETPLGTADCNVLESEIGLVPILRAGIGMADSIIKLIPNAKIGHIGLYRDPNTFQPIEYYCKLPKSDENMEIIVLDPMLATGGSASAAIQFIKERGFKNIKYLCLIVTPEGVKRIQADHPDVDVYAAAMDRVLNEEGYIVPGLGDAGDRIFGTK